MNKVSVIVPVYKVENYLDRCITSLVNQTYSNIEIILVDDGSPDNCPQICDEWKCKDDRIFVLHKSNGGLTSARIYGLERATGEYILFVDSDDYVELNMVELMMEKMIIFNPDLVMCSYFQECKDTCNEYCFNFSGLLEKKDIFDKYILPITQSGLKQNKVPGFMCIRLFKREFIKLDFFYDENKVFTEDDVFNVLYALDCKAIYVMDKALYHYIYNSSSLSNTYREGKFEMWCNRAKVFENAFAEHNIKVSKTDISFIYLPSVFSEINNSAIKLNYHDYKSKMKSMLKDDRIKNKLNLSTIKYLGKSHALSFLLLKLRFFRLLFLIRKKRLNLS